MEQKYKHLKNKYYEIVCKGGHVGRKRYYEMHVFIISTSKKEASQKCRHIPRVKRDHKNYILDCREINKDEYLIGNNLNKKQPYYTFKGKMYQKEYIKNESKNNPEKFYENYQKYIKNDEFNINKNNKKYNKKYSKKYFRISRYAYAK